MRSPTFSRCPNKPWLKEKTSWWNMAPFFINIRADRQGAWFVPFHQCWKRGPEPKQQKATFFKKDDFFTLWIDSLNWLSELTLWIDFDKVEAFNYYPALCQTNRLDHAKRRHVPTPQQIKPAFAKTMNTLQRGPRPNMKAAARRHIFEATITSGESIAYPILNNSHYVNNASNPAMSQRQRLWTT